MQATNPHSVLLEPATLIPLLALSLLAGAGIVFAWPLALLVAVLPILLAFVVFFLSKRDLLFWVLAVSAPLNDHLGIPVGGLMLRPYSLLTPMGLLLLLGLLVSSREERLRRRLLTVGLPLLVLGLFLFGKIVTTVLLSEFPVGMSRFFCLKMVIFAILLGGVMLTSLFLCGDRIKVCQFINFWFYFAHASLVLAFLQVLISNITSWEIVHHRDVVAFGRPFSVFREPDVFAAFLGSTFLMAFVLQQTAKQTVCTSTLLNWTMALCGVALLVLFVRAAWVGVLLCFVTYGFFMIKDGALQKLGHLLAKVVLGSLISILALVLVFPSAGSKLADRFLSMAEPKGESASEYRMRELGAMAEHVVPENMSLTDLPQFLLGYGDFSWSYWAPILLKDKYDQDAQKNRGRSAVLIHPGFNIVLAILHDNGVCGLTLFLLYKCSLIAVLLRVRKLGLSSEDLAVLLGLFLAVLCLDICFVFSYDPIMPFYWVLTGIYLAFAAQITQNEQRERAGEV